MTETSDGELRRSIDRLNSTIEQLQRDLVRKDVYDADERARSGALLGIADDVAAVDRKVDQSVEKLTKRLDDNDAKRAAERRLLVASFVAPFLLMVLSIYIASQIGVGR